MDEDENPFGDASRLPLETPSAFQTALSEASNQLSPSSSSRPFPSSGTGKGQIDPKTEFCCSTDRALHSGNDVEILVGRFSFLQSSVTDCPLDHRCTEDVGQCKLTLHHIHHQNWCMFLFCKAKKCRR